MCGIFCDTGRYGSIRQDDIDRQVHKLCDQFWKGSRIATGGTEFKDDVVPFDIPVFAEPLAECLEDRSLIGLGRGQDADARDLGGWLLRVGNRWPRDRCAACPCDERA